MRIELHPTETESAHRDEVLDTLRQYIRENRRIALPSPRSRAHSSGTLHRGEGEFALLRVGEEQNPFAGTVGPFRYQFEGEEDLLHLFVVRVDGGELSAEEGQAVAAFLLPDVPPGLVWVKPGRLSQHFFLGHDVLVAR